MPVIFASTSVKFILMILDKHTHTFTCWNNFHATDLLQKAISFYWICKLVCCTRFSVRVACLWNTLSSLSLTRSIQLLVFFILLADLSILAFSHLSIWASLLSAFYRLVLFSNVQQIFDATIEPFWLRNRKNVFHYLLVILTRLLRWPNRHLQFLKIVFCCLLIFEFFFNLVFFRCVRISLLNNLF